MRILVVEDEAKAADYLRCGSPAPTYQRASMRGCACVEVLY
ncbi:hypothetical protein SAMN05878437_2167 [Vreelandella subglaciescola]|jgi:DNA-binding response OmpR family regulator|uniref:Uncharacterized protein n=1 Tax=Vreelandella subglaciescola TaxID=29571 RepID=A0A1M7HJ19_9GAMM|nr:hypothetical protein SAMN05878437_2167 [Halomonas subglaciescola]